MAAQCFVFFLAGYETSSNALSFAMLEIAKNHSIQVKLQQEVDAVCGKYSGNITYESLQELIYMDQVLAGNFVESQQEPMEMKTISVDFIILRRIFVQAQ